MYPLYVQLEIVFGGEVEILCSTYYTWYCKSGDMGPGVVQCITITSFLRLLIDMEVSNRFHCFYHSVCTINVESIRSCKDACYSCCQPSIYSWCEVCIMYTSSIRFL